VNASDGDVVAGRLNKQIAAELGLSEATVRSIAAGDAEDACPVLGRAGQDGR